MGIKELFFRLRAWDRRTNYTCDVCGREVFANERICAACRETLPWNNALICPFCGRKVLEEGTCLECKQKPLETQKARSLFTHEGDAAALVYRFKGGRKYLARMLGEELASLARSEFAEAELVTFVPMTRKAERRRGYNQSRLLAEELAAQLQTPCLALAQKERESAPQKTLGRKEREENLEGCFRVVERAALKGKYVLLVDDTMTTGATASALAQRLKRAGARRVDLVTVTSVQKKQPFGKPPASK